MCRIDINILETFLKRSIKKVVFTKLSSGLMHLYLRLGICRDT